MKKRLFNKGLMMVLATSIFGMSTLEAMDINNQPYVGNYVYAGNQEQEKKDKDDRVKNIAVIAGSVIGGCSLLALIIYGFHKYRTRRLDESKYRGTVDLNQENRVEYVAIDGTEVTSLEYKQQQLQLEYDRNESRKLEIVMDLERIHVELNQLNEKLKSYESLESYEKRLNKFIAMQEEGDLAEYFFLEKEGRMNVEDRENFAQYMLEQMNINLRAKKKYLKQLREKFANKPSVENYTAYHDAFTMLSKVTDTMSYIQMYKKANSPQELEKRKTCIITKTDRDEMKKFIDENPNYGTGAIYMEQDECSSALDKIGPKIYITDGIRDMNRKKDELMYEQNKISRKQESLSRDIKDTKGQRSVLNISNRIEDRFKVGKI